MIQLLLHLIGDYLTQSDWMSLNKKKPGIKGDLACLVHCMIYSLPFFLITNWIGVLFIFITHYIIDRSNIIETLLSYRNCNITWDTKTYKLIFQRPVGNFGYALERPKLISVWLYIITDNTVHLICNYLIIFLLP